EFGMDSEEDIKVRRRRGPQDGEGPVRPSPASRSDEVHGRVWMKLPKERRHLNGVERPELPHRAYGLGQERGKVALRICLLCAGGLKFCKPGVHHWMDAAVELVPSFPDRRPIRLHFDRLRLMSERMHVAAEAVR